MHTFLIALGIALVALGLTALRPAGDHVHDPHEKILEIGPIRATAERDKTIELPPALGAISLVGGIGLLVAAARR